MKQDSLFSSEGGWSRFPRCNAESCQPPSPSAGKVFGSQKCNLYFFKQNQTSAKVNFHANGVVEWRLGQAAGWLILMLLRTNPGYQWVFIHVWEYENGAG